MLTCVDIANYRGFKSFRVEGLSRVNLLVGKNNSGKTALLEGIQFLTSGGDPVVLAEAAQRRGEIVMLRPEPSMLVDIAHFFNGHALALDASFSITGDNGFAPVSVKTYAQKNDRGEANERGPSGAGPAGIYLRITGPAALEKEERRFRITREGGVDFEVSSRLRRLGPMRRPVGPPTRFVGTESLHSTELAIMWDEVTLSGQERDVATAMRVLDPNLESLHFLTGMLASGYFPARGGIVVGMAGQEGRVPLGSMGDGMRRLMALATSLASAKGGCLFVDEIDTGLHYSVMTDMWKLVVRKAVASDIQVFATTHSWDCIEGLSLLCQRDPEMLKQIAIHKIDREIPHSVAFPGESVVRMIKSDIDPR